MNKKTKIRQNKGKERKTKEREEREEIPGKINGQPELSIDEQIHWSRFSSLAQVGF